MSNDTPEPPQGVRLLRVNGDQLPCELVYDGQDDDGMHLWLVTGVQIQPGDQLAVDVMPAMTGIGFRTSKPHPAAV